MATAPQSLLEVLGTTPQGKVLRLTTDQMTQFLASKYRSRTTDERRLEAKKRLDFFRDRGRVHFERSIDELYKNAKVRSWRKDFVRFAMYQNITKRVVREVSAVYSEPAKRLVKSGNDAYQALLRVTRFDRKMRQVNRYGNLLNHCLVWPDVLDDGTPVMRVITTDHFEAVAHPNDPTRPVAFIIDQYPQGLGVGDRSPHYLVMTAAEFFHLDKAWRFVEGSHQPHNLGRMPALLWSREEPDDRILDGDSGRDLISAHEAVALLNTLMLKHQKSGTKMAYASGDVSGMAAGQPMDEEHLLQAPEGVALSTLDLGAEPSSYIDTVRAVIKQVAANYGIPESVFDLSYQATSGFEIELKRAGLREIRRDQMLDFRPFEMELAELWSVVLGAARHPMAFSADGWSLDFGEVDTPQDPTTKLEYWSRLEEMGLANRIEMYLEMNPEATEAEAIRAIEFNQNLRLAQIEKFQHTGAAGKPMVEGSGRPMPSDEPPPDDGQGEEVAA